MTQLLPCVTVEPTVPQGQTLPGTVLWLHGLGADGHDFEPVVPLLGLPQIRFVFPHAPSRPVTINGGMVMRAWYDIVQPSPKGASRPHVLESVRQVEALLEREWERNVPPSRLVLAGFSQGGALALHTGLRYRHSLLGILVLSAGELFPETRQEEASEANRSTPILCCHGTMDPLVSVERGRETYERLVEEGRKVEWREFPIAHEVSMPEIQLIGEWLRKLFREPASTTG